MAIAHDAGSETTGTGDLSWTHSPSGTPRGVLVFVNQTPNLGDEVAGVTYGGVTMSRINVGSSDGFLAHNPGGTTDDGAVYAYFLGSSVPTGNQTVAVDTTATATIRHGVAVTVTASADVEIEGSNEADQTGTAANPSITVTTGAGVVTQAYAMMFNGTAAPADVTDGTDTTRVHDHDMGTCTSIVSRSTSTDSGSNVTLAWTVAADDYAIIAVALKEAAAPTTYEKAGFLTPFAFMSGVAEGPQAVIPAVVAARR